MKKLLYILICIFSFANADTRLMITYKPSESEQKLLSSSNVKYRLKARQDLMQPLSKLKLRKLENRVHHKVYDLNYLATGGRVVRLDGNYSKNEIKNIIQELKTDPNVLSVEEDVLLTAADYQTNSYQWSVFKTTSSISGMNLSTYYGDNFYNSADNNMPNTTLLGRNGQDVMVAVIDSGYVPHPNFVSQLSNYSISQISGYTFISDCRIAGTCPVSQINGESSYYVNGLDLGDGYTCNDYNDSAADFKSVCPNTCNQQYASLRTSSWHGTHVTGIIAGQGSSNPTYVNLGVLGSAYKAKILPVRVLGKCGGYYSDIINAMLWASGVSSIESIPLPTTPAKVLNMSLGSGMACTEQMQTVINSITANGGIVVVAAGNGSANISNFTPANCQNVISVAAVAPDNKLAYYSNYGNVSIAASGGDILNYSSGGVFSTLYNSTSTFNACSGANCYIYAQFQGTSMATPNVVGLIADMLSINPDLTFNQVRSILVDSGESFTNCYTVSKCANTVRINPRQAVSYAINNVPTLDSNINSINFSEESGVLDQEITISNQEPVAITIGSLKFSGQDESSFRINSTTCSNNLVLQPYNTCKVNISPIINQNVMKGNTIQTNNTLTANFEIYNIYNIRILLVPLSYTSGITPTPEPTISPEPTINPNPTAEPTVIPDPTVNPNPTIEPTLTPEPTVNPEPIPSPTIAPIIPTGGGGGCTMVNNGSDIGILLLIALVWLYRRTKRKLEYDIK